VSSGRKVSAVALSPASVGHSGISHWMDHWSVRSRGLLRDRFHSFSTPLSGGSQREFPKLLIPFVLS